MLRIESLSLTEYRHLLHCATEECTYRLKRQKQVFIAQEIKLDFCLTIFSYFNICHWQQTTPSSLFTKSTHPPVWEPIHMVGRTLVIFSVSSNWTSLSTDIGLSPSLMSSECLCRSSEAREDRDTGVFVPEFAGEPLALNTEGWTSSEPKCTAIKGSNGTQGWRKT